MSGAPVAASLPPETTAQQDLTTAGQRKVNLVWEYTQAALAITIVLGYMILIVRRIPVPTTLDNLLFVVITFYYARTNHTRIGGVGLTAYQRDFGSR